MRTAYSPARPTCPTPQQLEQQRHQRLAELLRQAPLATTSALPRAPGAQKTKR